MDCSAARVTCVRRVNIVVYGFLISWVISRVSNDEDVEFEFDDDDDEDDDDDNGGEEDGYDEG